MLPVIIKEGVTVLLVCGMLLVGGIKNLSTTEVEITNIDKQVPGWEYIEGHYGEYDFMGKVYDEASRHGIGGGRISKLWIGKNNSDGTATWVLNYDRGWDIEPKSEKEIEMSNKIINELENE